MNATHTLRFVFLLAAALLLSPCLSQAQCTTSAADQQKNPGTAYQDGFEHGRTDARSFMPSYGQPGGQWTTEETQSAYTMGYGAGYLEGTSYPDRSASFLRRTAANEKQGASADAARIGYEDGHAAGSRALDAGNAYRPADSTTYKKADDGWSAASGNKEQYQQAYRDAYVRGYQEGYGNSPTTY